MSQPTIITPAHAPVVTIAQLREKLPLTALQRDGLDLALRHGGKLERRPSGHWTYPGCPPTKEGSSLPVATVSTATVMGLVKWGLMRVVEMRRGVPCRVEIRLPEGQP